MPDTTPVPVPATVQDLIQRFAMHREAYKTPDYNETQVRREFIDPLFKALGWDVDNEKGYAEQSNGCWTCVKDPPPPQPAMNRPCCNARLRRRIRKLISLCMSCTA